MFLCAQPVWLAGLEDEMNVTAAFSLETGPLEGAVLQVAAADFYRLWVNGRFAAFGPARTARGYARVDVIALDAFDGGPQNEIVLEVAGYQCRSLSTVKQPPFLQAELRRGGQALAYTGRDFIGHRVKSRVQHAERYSYQRHFSEVWDFRGAASQCSGCPHPWTVVERPLKLLCRAAPYPCYSARGLPACRSAGQLLYDATLPYQSDNFSVPISERWGGFTPDVIEHFPYRWIQQCRQQPQRHDAALPLPLKAGDYALFDFGRIEVGFLRLAVEAAADSEIIVAFSEYCSGDLFSFTDMHVQNTVDFLLAAGQRREVMSFEPYSFRFVLVAVRQGELHLEGFGMTAFERDMSAAPMPELSSPALDRIYRGALRTFAHNALDLYTDCPSRERAGWLCDSYFTGRTEYALFGCTPTEDAFLENYALYPQGEGLPEGALPMCYPSDIPDDGKFIPQWTMWYILEVEEYVHNRNHEEQAGRFRSSVYRLLDFYRRYENEDGLLERLPSWNFVEWSQANDWTQDVNYPTNFLYAQALECAGRLYADEDCLKRSARVRATALAQSFDGRYFLDHAQRDAAGKLRVAGDISEIGQYYAVLFGGLDLSAPRYQRLRQSITGDFAPGSAARDPRIVPVNAFIGVYLRLETLYRMGEYALMLRDIEDFFGQMEAYTGTLWENRDFHGSYDHGFASYVASLLIAAHPGPHASPARHGPDAF